MRIRHRSVYSFLFLVLLALINWFIKSDELRNPQAKMPSPTPTRKISEEVMVVKRVVDGDTIELQNGKKLRYIGIDTPETKDPQQKMQCYGQEAYIKNKELVEGKEVRLVKDTSETDRYGRLLRYVYLVPVATGEAEIFVNEYLVREGYAQAVTFPPDVKFNQYFQELQKKATAENKGLWSNCSIKN